MLEYPEGLRGPGPSCDLISCFSLFGVLPGVLGGDVMVARGPKGGIKHLVLEHLSISQEKLESVDGGGMSGYPAYPAAMVTSSQRSVRSEIIG